jgi:hypothetical protein
MRKSKLSLHSLTAQATCIVDNSVQYQDFSTVTENVDFKLDASHDVPVVVIYKPET